MSLEKLKRVAWRLKEMKTKEPGLYTYKQLRLAVMEEIGTDERTIDVTIKKMAELGIIKPADLGKVSLDDERTQE